MEDSASNCGQPSSITFAPGGQSIVLDTDGVAVLDAGSAVGLLRFKWLEPQNEISERWGVPRAGMFPECARFKFGRGRSGEARCALRGRGWSYVQRVMKSLSGC